MMNHRMFFIYLIVVLTVAAPQLPAQTLDDYIKTAAENNPELRSAFNQYLAALQRVPQVTALPDPNVMFSYYASVPQMDWGKQQAGIGVSQEFPWFGQLGAQGDAATELAKSRLSAFMEIRNKLIFDVRSTYFELYYLESSIRVTDRNLTLLASFRELANIRLESALGSAADLLRVEMEWEELNNQLLYFNDTRIPVRTRFKQLLNADTLPVFKLPDTLKTEPLTTNQQVLMDSIKANNPSLTKFDHEMASIDHEITVAEKMGLPSFSIGLDYTYVVPGPGTGVPDNGKDMWVFPQVGVRIPLYRSKYNAMIREQEILRASVEEERANRVNELNTSLETMWRDYADAERRVKLFARLAILATQALDVIVAEYTSAGTEFEEILRMNRQLLRYELELEKARADQNTTISYVNYLTGKQY